MFYSCKMDVCVKMQRIMPLKNDKNGSCNLGLRNCITTCVPERPQSLFVLNFSKRNMTLR